MKRIIIIFGVVWMVALTQGSAPTPEKSEADNRPTTYYSLTGAMVIDTVNMPNGIYIRTQCKERTTKIIKH